MNLREVRAIYDPALHSSHYQWLSTVGTTYTYIHVRPVAFLLSILSGHSILSRTMTR